MKKLILIGLVLSASVGCKSLQPHDSPMPESAHFTPTIEGVTANDNQTIDIRLLSPNAVIIVKVNGVIVDRYTYTIDPALQYIQLFHEVERLPDGRVRIKSQWIAPKGSSYRIEGYPAGEVMP